MNRPLDLTGSVYGKLKVIGPVESRKTGRYWGVACSCGSPPKFVSFNNLRSGSITSCGCGKYRVHGLSRHPYYPLWSSMLKRCEVPTCKEYKRYGARGVKVDPRWRSFPLFLEDLPLLGEKPPGYSLDRKDNNKDYSVDNCRWASAKTQGNNKGNNILVEYLGQTMTLPEASEASGVPLSTLYSRVYSGKGNLFRGRYVHS